MEILLVILVSYLMGSIPFGLLFSKLFGYGDLRKSGSGNIGTTNAMRVGGKKLGILTLVFDAIKAMIPLMIFGSFGFSDELLAISGGVAVCGHIFPIWLKFKGGKGVATAGAVLLTLVPYVGLIFVVAWVFIFALTKVVSKASLIAIFVSTVAAFWFGTSYFIMTLVFCLLIFYRHKDNIVRIINGSELSFRK